MKKIITASFCLLLGVAVSAQEVSAEQLTANGRAKNADQSLLPEQGDFAIGIDASPILTYVGSIFSSGGNSAPTFVGPDGGTSIYGKYFLQDNRAIRAKLRVNAYALTGANTVTDEGAIQANPLDINATAIDRARRSVTDIQLTAGYEFRRGYKRIQGFYGGEAILGYKSSSMTYMWANEMNQANQNPISTAWNQGTNTNAPSGNTSATQTVRNTEAQLGRTFMIGAQGFAGVEYFIAPKLSLGGEFHLGLAYQVKTVGNITKQRWNDAIGGVETRTVRGGLTPTDGEGNSAGGLFTNTNNQAFTPVALQTGASIFMIFHF